MTPAAKPSPSPATLGPSWIYELLPGLVLVDVLWGVSMS